uniref:Tetraspanin n=1 Tax=Syphacia muris TaxID=451379 RepID=A0A0N5B0U8_9BILA
MGAFGRWTAYSSFGRTVRLIFFVTSAVSMVFSTICCIYGIWLTQTRSQFSELLSPSLYADVANIMVVISIFAIINGFMSIWAVNKELRCMIYTGAAASVVIFVMLCVGGVMGFVFTQQLSHQIPLHLKMLTSLKELYGTPEMDGMTSAWDELQTDFKCCGVNGTDNIQVWKQSKWYMRQKKPKQIIPVSCCATKDIGSCLKLLAPVFAVIYARLIRK